MKIKSVSQNIFRQADSNLNIKLTATLLDGMDEDNFYSLYESSVYDYLSINIQAYISIQYKTVGIYDKSQVVRIVDEDLFQVNKKLQEFYRKLSRTDLFTYYKSGNIECNKRRDDIINISLKTGGYLEMEPGVIIDKNTNIIFPGVYLYINNKSQKTEITINEYEYLMYKFSKIDISSEGLKLIITRLLLDSKLTSKSSIVKDDNTATYINNNHMGVVNKFNNVPHDKVEMVIGRTPIKTISSLDELM